MKKTVAIIVLAAMLVGLFGAVAYARYTYIDMVSASIAIVGGKATVDGTVSAFNQNTLNIVLVLERKPSGGTWSTYDSWSASKANATRLSSSGSCTVPSGYSYRAKVTGTVNGESAVAYSGELQY